jgi:hypothetical protein
MGLGHNENIPSGKVLMIMLMTTYFYLFYFKKHKQILYYKLSEEFKLHLGNVLKKL